MTLKGAGKTETAEQPRQEIPRFGRSVKARMQNLRKILENSFIADLEHHAEIRSTNDRAIECGALADVNLPFLIIADRQTAGRGRGSNRWWTGPGSLAFSLLVGPETVGAAAASTCGPRRSGLVGLAVGVAVVDALAPLVPGHEIGIHWPNDVILDRRKLAGVLIEVLPDGKHVIGIGVNTNNTAADAPEEVRRRVVTLRDVTGREHDSTEILLAILRNSSGSLASWSARRSASPSERMNSAYSVASDWKSSRAKGGSRAVVSALRPTGRCCLRWKAIRNRSIPVW